MNDKQNISKSSEWQIIPTALFNDVQDIIRKGMKSAYASVNTVQIRTYWNIGKRIVEEEQNGADRATYGARLIEELSHLLSHDFPKGYSARDLRRYRQFYLKFKDLEIWQS